MKPSFKIQPIELLAWYKENFRPLPWRKGRDPYKIWISEIMLQQTTVTAVLPYYEKFLERFPNVKILAKAALADVLEYWSGLGYYSRAENLHAAAQIIAAHGFPTTYQELIKLPGFGPYTARAVASFAFSEKVGVLDGNVIRFLSRFHAQDLEWWKPSARAQLQELADAWAQSTDNLDINQALIEIGATICVASSPKCLICPLMSTCLTVGTDKLDSRPLKKARQPHQIWLWEIDVYAHQDRFALIQNKEALPVLKDNWIWPGTASRVKTPPTKFDFKHCVTHHNIYVCVRYKKQALLPRQWENAQWLKRSDIKKVSPMSLVNKVFSYLPVSR